MQGSDISDADDSSSLVCDAVSLDEHFLTFHGIVVPLKFGTTYPWTWCHIL